MHLSRKKEDIFLLFFSVQKKKKKKKSLLQAQNLGKVSPIMHAFVCMVGLRDLNKVLGPVLGLQEISFC